MQSLTSQNFAEAMTLCNENSCYFVCIVFANRKEMTEFIAALKEVGNIPGVRRVLTRRADYGRLEFFNGSILEIIPSTEDNIRGRRCNQLITSGDFSRKAQAYMEGIIFPYRATVSAEAQFFNTALFNTRSRQQTEWVSLKDDSFTESVDEVSEELDSFLDSFIVNQNVNKTAL